MLRAYNQWNDIPNTRDKWDFCRENFLSGKTLDMIAQLKRQLLELLSGCGFAPPNIRAPAIEYAGRRAGNDGVTSVIASVYNQNAGDPLIIKAVLTAAMFPRVVKKIDVGKKGELKFTVHDTQQDDDARYAAAAENSKMEGGGGGGGGVGWLNLN